MAALRYGCAQLQCVVAPLHAVARARCGVAASPEPDPEDGSAQANAAETSRLAVFPEFPHGLGNLHSKKGV